MRRNRDRQAKPDPNAPPARSRFEGFVRKLWWLHSCWALVFGIGVMIYARRGLAHADKLLLILGASWFLVFFALRFIVGPENVKPDDKLLKKGLRLGTNYIIKNLYQQMLFFLVPLYASSTTWSFESSNWWLAPVLLVCAVLSTMDLVMDNFVMQRRLLASVMYAFCMFGVMNLILPIAVEISQFTSLLIAAAAAVPAVALLTFRLRSVCTVKGLSLVVVGTGLLIAGAYYGAPHVPPAPLAMAQGGVSHGTSGSEEVVPGHKDVISREKLTGLRCVTKLTKPGGVHDEILHIWQHGGSNWIIPPERVITDSARDFVYRSTPSATSLQNPIGDWVCRVETADGQLVGRLTFRIE